MARPIMIQGTMSNAGKSLLAAGLCRIFHQDGYRTAPFKSQNMALNSYITADGLEMGRAQAVQAEAAGILPETAMNPILLKPTSHTGSQVIVNGRVLGNYPASQYYKMKGQLIPHVLQAYESLASRFDIIVIEFTVLCLGDEFFQRLHCPAIFIGTIQQQQQYYYHKQSKRIH